MNDVALVPVGEFSPMYDLAYGIFAPLLAGSCTYFSTPRTSALKLEGAKFLWRWKGATSSHFRG